MSAALAMLLFCNYSEQYRKIASSMLSFAHTSCFAKEILAGMLLQMQAFDEHPLIFHGPESLHYFFKASSAACLAASNTL